MKVEIGQYYEKNNGCLKATFTLLIHPMGQKILGCKYFVNGDKRWISFPSKEIVDKKTGEKDYIPLISYLNKEYKQELTEAVLEQIKVRTPNDKKSHTQKAPQDDVQDETSSLWF